MTSSRTWAERETDMAVDVNINLSDALDGKITARWGTTLAWKQWVKDKTKLEIAAADERKIIADSLASQAAALAAAQAANAVL